MLPSSKYFPPAETADEDGFLGVGGELSPEWLLDAYQHGIFPWPIFDENEPMAWWSLDPRAIFEFDAFHVSRRLRRRLQSPKYSVTCNQAFAEVIDNCSKGKGREGGTWLFPSMIAAYKRMHHLGHAHSVEVWKEERLIGGVYGLAIAGLFAAESMFYRERDGSKIALAHLVAHLKARKFKLLDIQQLTDHTRRLGASEISRREYLKRLEAALQAKTSFGAELCGKINSL